MRSPGWLAVIGIAAVFALSHLVKTGITPVQIVSSIFLTGTLYGWLRLDSGSTVPPVCSHISYNCSYLSGGSVPPPAAVAAKSKFHAREPSAPFLLYWRSIHDSIRRKSSALVIKAARRVGTPLGGGSDGGPSQRDRPGDRECQRQERASRLWSPGTFIGGLQGRNEAGKSALAKVLGENSPRLGRAMRLRSRKGSRPTLSFSFSIRSAFGSRLMWCKASGT